MNKKTILKKACGKGGPLVNAAQGIERGVGNIASNAVSGYKKGGIVGGLAGAGKGVAQNAISNLKGAGSAIKTTLFGPGVKSGLSKVSKIPSVSSPKLIGTSVSDVIRNTKASMPKATSAVKKPQDKYLIDAQKRMQPKIDMENKRTSILKNIVKEKSQGGYQPTRPSVKRA